MATTPPSLESLRRQLEGRWERIEQARERYTRIRRQLSSFQWRSALRSQPQLLKEAREQEAELTEVLAYVEHRAHQEQWPRNHPGLRVLQELRGLRAELDALAHERLARPPSPNGAALVEALGELETLAFALPPRPPGADDPVLFEDWMLSWPSPGRVWLTPARLLWQPGFGDPIQLPLSSLEPEAITLLPGWWGVHLKRRGLTLLSLSYAETLASLLRLGVRTVHLAHEQPRTNDVATSPAYCRHVDHVLPERWGLGVFGPHGAALLPARHRTLLDLCLNLVGFRARAPRPSELRQLEALVEHLLGSSASWCPNRRTPSTTSSGAIAPRVTAHRPNSIPSCVSSNRWGAGGESTSSRRASPPAWPSSTRPSSGGLRRARPSRSPVT